MPADRPSLKRRRLALHGLAALAGAWVWPRHAMAVEDGGAACGPWPAWDAFVGNFLQDDGRVVDPGEPDRRSTSEGQSYALFFALVGNDQARFDRILQWTENNLAQGDLTRHLPAWWWGHDVDSGTWRVLDDNSASDADLWLAYALIEAARLWGRPGLGETGMRLLQTVRAREVLDVPGLGAMLLPGAIGFVEADLWRFNPSYLPLPLLRRFAAVDRRGPWPAMARNTLAMLVQASPHGFAPDWVACQAGRFVVDPAKGAIGSYDAIRVYLWAGMTAPDDPAAKTLLRSLHGPLDLLQREGRLAERVDTRTGTPAGSAPYGFHAALLPYLQAQGQSSLVMQLRGSMPTVEQQRQALAYYAQALALFGLGWLEGRYRFGRDGRLQPGWLRCTTG